MVSELAPDLPLDEFNAILNEPEPKRHEAFVRIEMEQYWRDGYPPGFFIDDLVLLSKVQLLSDFVICPLHIQEMLLSVGDCIGGLYTTKCMLWIYRIQIR